MANLEIKLVRGLAGKRKDQKEVVASLGLKKPNQVRIHPDNAATQGKINKVKHLIEVKEV